MNLQFFRRAYAKFLFGIFQYSIHNLCEFHGCTSVCMMIIHRVIPWSGRTSLSTIHDKSQLSRSHVTDLFHLNIQIFEMILIKSLPDRLPFVINDYFWKMRLHVHQACLSLRRKVFGSKRTKHFLDNQNFETLIRGHFFFSLSLSVNGCYSFMKVLLKANPKV